MITPENESINLTLSSVCKKVRLTSGSWPGAAHPSCDSLNTSRYFELGASNICWWSVKTRLAPSRYRDAMVYGHTTAGMHGNEYIPPLRALVASDSQRDSSSSRLRGGKRYAAVHWMRQHKWKQSKQRCSCGPADPVGTQ